MSRAKRRRNYSAPIDEQRCAWDIVLRDGSAARCMRQRTVGAICTQHAKMRDAMTCEYCGMNDEHPPEHCTDCTRPQEVTP